MFRNKKMVKRVLLVATLLGFIYSSGTHSYLKHGEDWEEICKSVRNLKIIIIKYNVLYYRALLKVQSIFQAAKT